MWILQAAFYIAILVFILLISTKVMWLFLMLFSYRFWESIISFETLSNILSIESHVGYRFIILVFALLSYGLVLWCSRKVKPLQYILLAALFFWAVRTNTLMDLFFFKDYFEEKGMWDVMFWRQQVAELFMIGPEEGGNILNKTMEKVGGLLNGFADFVRKM